MSSLAADIWKSDRRAAELHRVEGGLELRFLPGFDRLSTRLRLGSSDLRSPGLDPFFLNLVPEGTRFQMLMDASRAKDDYVDLLLKIGWETVGDVAILPPGVEPRMSSNIEAPTEWNQLDFWQLFREGIEVRPDAAIPGAQEKISDSSIAFPVKPGAQKKSILKLNPPRYPRLVQNEEFFLRVAKDCGLEVNRAQIVQDGRGEYGLLMQRFDRKVQRRKVIKFAQEDGCQLLNLTPSRKYDPNLRQIADQFVMHCTAPIVDIERLLRLYAFSYLIGNADLHAKNVSIIWRDTAGMTPGYDLLSTLPYPSLQNQMAMKLLHKDAQFRPGDFVEFGLRYDIPEKAVLNMLRRLTHRIGPWLNRLDEIGFDDETTVKMKAEIERRLVALIPA